MTQQKIDGLVQQQRSRRDYADFSVNQFYSLTVDGGLQLCISDSKRLLKNPSMGWRLQAFGQRRRVNAFALHQHAKVS